MTATPNRATRVSRWIGSHRMLVALLVGAAVVVWIGIVALRMLDAHASLEHAVDRLQAAQLKLEPSEILNGRADRSLDRARREFEDAYADVDSVFVAPFRVLPVVGRQINAVRAMSDSAGHALAVAQNARHALKGVLVDGWDKRGQRVPSMLAFEKIADRALAELRNLDLGPRDALIGPIARAQDRFQEKLHEARTLLGQTRDVSAGLAAFLQGPSRYLLLVANNAEMRAGSGMVLDVGVIEAAGGHLVQVSMQSVGDLMLPPGAVAVGPGDFADRWGWLLPNEDWRNLAASPNFAATASLASDMWKAKTGEAVDGVLMLDPFALQALLATSGPITVGDVRLDSENVLQYILHDQYAGLGVERANEVRRDRLGDIADVAVQEFDHGSWKLSSLLDELRGVVEGRHLLAWSPDPIEHRGWEAAGVAGELHADSLMVSVMNFGGNKLDRFLDVSADIGVTPGDSGSEVRVQIKVHNDAPANDSGYVLGPEPGVYRGFVAVDVPGYALAPKLEGVDELVAGGPEGAATVLAGPIRLERGDTKTYVVTFTLPQGASGLDVEASARFPAIDWTFGTETWLSGAVHHVEW